MMVFGRTFVVTIIPSISVSVRCLHDLNKSGWWLLLVFTIIGILPFLYWMSQKADDDYETSYVS